MCSLDRTYIHAWEDYALTMIVISQSTVFLLALQVLKHVKAVQNLDGCKFVCFGTGLQTTKKVIDTMGI